MRLDPRKELYALGNEHGYRGIASDNPKVLRQKDYAAGRREGRALRVKRQANQ